MDTMDTVFWVVFAIKLFTFSDIMTLVDVDNARTEEDAKTMKAWFDAKEVFIWANWGAILE